MIRRIIVAILRFAMRVYFRQVEVVGIDKVPRDTPVIFVLNHPNALVDPAFLLAWAPRRVSFLAKSPLFRMPVLGYFVRAMDSLPVYRRQDEGEDVSKNREMFVAARALLARGGTIGICPEGVSHDEPRLKPIKTGAARIALGAVSTGEVADLKIVPAGLYYTSKTKFRSAVLLYFGFSPQNPPTRRTRVLPKSCNCNNASSRPITFCRNVHQNVCAGSKCA
jgi:1-acyl-sn-glycerol-3-phosphate acyltransferase